MCMKCPQRHEFWNPQSCSYRRTWANIWILIIKPQQEQQILLTTDSSVKPATLFILTQPTIISQGLDKVVMPSFQECDMESLCLVSNRVFIFVRCVMSRVFDFLMIYPQNNLQAPLVAL